MSNFPNNRKPLTNFQLDFHLFYSFCFCVCWFHPVHRQSVSDSRCSIEIAFFLMCLFHTLKLMIASLCMGSEATTKKAGMNSQWIHKNNCCIIILLTHMVQLNLILYNFLFIIFHVF